MFTFNIVIYGCRGLNTVETLDYTYQSKQNYIQNIFFFLFKDSDLLYRTREGDVVKLNVLTNTTEVLVKNKMFESFRNQVLMVL